MIKIKYNLLGLLIFVFGGSSYAQNKELKMNMNEDGSHYVKATFLNQVWVRYTQNNPGSTVFGYPEAETFDIGLRRTRVQLFGQISDRIFFYTQFGTNNLSYNGTRKQGLFFHDAIGELKISKDYLSVGAGLTGWSGLSRYASPSVGTILSLDAPLYQQATNDVNDQFLRKFSVYAKGKIDKLDYRFAITKPMSINTSAQSPFISDKSQFSSEPAKAQYQGYVMYQFKDKESNLTPYTVGSYLGKKDVFNIGAGFIYQHNALWHSIGQDTAYNDMMLCAVDVFYDHPINKEKNTAITAYAAFSSTDYGKNYVRNIGVMNPATGSNDKNILNGSGDGAPLIGTGNTVYAQVGYLLKKDLIKLGTLQPYAAAQYSQFQNLKDPMLMYEAGFNWLIEGHRTKISCNYQSRPVFSKDAAGDWISSQRKGMLVAQMQVSI